MNIIKAISILAIVLMLAGCVDTPTTTIPSTEVSTIKTIETPTPKIIATPIPDERSIDITYFHKINNYVGMRESGSSSGMTYLFITMTIENHGYHSFNVNPYNWAVEINNIRYSHHWVTYDLKDRLSTQDIMDGGSLTGSIAFEIPRNGTNPNNYEYSIIYDETFDDYNINYHKT
jgi:hypothetical protein